MCHSVEMYLPKITRDAAERALAADRAAAARERAVVDGVLALGRRLATAARAGWGIATRLPWPALAALLLLGACAKTAPAPAPADVAYTREPPVLAGNDTNVYHFEHAGPNSLGTLAVMAYPTAGPNAAPGGTLAGLEGQTKAEAAAAFYAENALCGGARFLLASDATSQYDPSRNSWTVFGRCASA